MSGPSSSTTSIGRILNGMLINDDVVVLNNSQPITGSTRCVTDRFQVTNPGGMSPPIICGQNTGEHSKLEKFEFAVLHSFNILEVFVVA